MPPTGVSPSGSPTRSPIESGSTGEDRPKVQELAVVRRFRTWRARHTLLVDAVLATGVLVLTYLISARGWGLPTLLLQLAAIVPLIWRRRAPFPILCVVAGAEVLAIGLEYQLPGFALAIACYTVVVHERPRNALLAVATMVTVTVARTLQWPIEGVVLQQVLNLVLINGLVAVLGFAVRMRQAHLSALEERAARLEIERDQQAQLAAAAERARIAREMHDIVAHNLAMMISLADGAAAAMRSQPERARVALDALSSTGRQALDELRRVLGVLRGDQADSERSPQPVLADLELLVGRIRAAGLPVEFTVRGLVDRLPESAQLAVYRLVQEALTNVLKHGGPGTSATVAVEFASSGVDLTVTNTGWAPAPSERSGGGHGLVGMRERVAVYGGSVEAGPRPGGGWHVHATIPANGSTVDSRR